MVHSAIAGSRGRAARLHRIGAACGVVAAAAFLGAAPASGAAALGGTAAGRAAAPRFHPIISVHAPGNSVKAAQSNNWSGYNEGYLDTHTTFSSVSGEWTVPTATQHTPGQAESSATWVGIGGGCLSTSCTATDSTLIQAGTEQDVSASGAASYSAWWELVPVPSVTASIAVHPGDLIRCSISSTLPGVWSIVLKDLTDGQGFTETVPYPSTEDTAEWIEESPLVIGTSGAGIAALPDLGKVSFSDATVNGHSAGLVPGEAIQLVSSSGAVLATPSAPASTDNAFNDCTYATTCPAP